MNSNKSLFKGEGKWNAEVVSRNNNFTDFAGNSKVFPAVTNLHSILILNSTGCFT